MKPAFARIVFVTSVVSLLMLSGYFTFSPELNGWGGMLVLALPFIFGVPITWAIENMR